MDEILTSTSAELEDLTWLSSAMNKFEHVETKFEHVDTSGSSGFSGSNGSSGFSGSNGSGGLAVISSSTHHTPWTMADESGDHDFFSEDSSEEPCIKRPRKFILLFLN